ncbi:thioredoxin-like protein [Thelephora terrestris]|uniref:glutathione transferase n=1 Tax=Thelephora terrestris TaxID=56493 RepID=A0A9P6HMS3_9AGAM|nr:thioredoxin-like protein [Thelephora terrestris]
MVLTVHHLDNSRSQRILWLLEELQVPYEVKPYKRDAEHHAPKELKDVHILGASPVLTEGDFVLAESGAIVEYLLRKYGKQRETLPESAQIDDIYFTHYAEGSLMPILLSKIIYRMIPERAPVLLKPFLWCIFDALSHRLVTPQLRTHREYIEVRLGESEGGFFAGGSEPTAADFMMIFPLELWGKMFPESFGPRCREYIDRIHERCASQTSIPSATTELSDSIEKGGEYDLF